MRIIAHRGNLDGPKPLLENSPEYIDEAIQSGFDVEIDVRCEDHHFYLGHDNSQYYVPMLWLYQRRNNLWIHCKDLKSLDVFSNSPVDFHYFWHENDRYTLTSRGIGWVYPGMVPYNNSIIVLPESSKFYDHDEGKYHIINSKGICTDFSNKYRELFGDD